MRLSPLGQRDGNPRDTGSDADYGNAWQSDFTGAEYRGAGHRVTAQTVAYPFYRVNPARNNGQDLEPIPITPVRKQNWPEMQIQLRNAWGTLSWGRKLTYDDYLRMLTDSATKQRTYLIPQPSSVGRAGFVPGPSPINVSNYVQSTSGSQPSSVIGPGGIASGINLGDRTYYG